MIFLCLELVITIVHVRVSITLSVSLLSPPFFSPHTAVVTANVTSVVLKNYWGSIECVVTLIVSQQCDWMRSHEAAEAVYPSPLTCTSAHCMRVCAGCVEWAATAVYPPSVYPPFKHIQTKHTHQMLACPYKDMHGCLHTNTYTQTHASRSRGHTALHTFSNTITLLLSLCFSL